MSTAENATRTTLRVVDDRFGSAGFLRRAFNKVFPDHWSFLLGEIALYTFVILLLTGTFLTFFFKASSAEVVYNGSYLPLRGVTMTQAFSSTLHVSFDVRGGLIIRQIHHWAALVFVSSIVVHMFRVFFTGAFRKPREVNWVIGTTLLVLAILEGFAGYSLPDDLLSGTGIRIAYSVMESVPVVGSWMAYFIFGGNYPGTDFIPRLYIIHVLLVPGILLALIGAHMMIIWHQKHTDFPGAGKTPETVTGSRFFPVFFVKTNGFLFLVFGVLALLGGFVQINPVWLYGPYNPAQVSAGSQPDWYIGFLEGSLRLMPNWETNIAGHTISWNVLVPGVVLPGIMFTLLGVYPFLEAWVRRDHGFHDVLDRPRDNAARTGIGAMAITFYMILLLAGGNDILANTFNWSINSITWAFRFLIVIAPPVAYFATKRVCIGLQRSDAELLHHGVESGVIVRSPSGEYYEPTTALPQRRRELLATAHDGTAHADGHSADGHSADGHGADGDAAALSGAGTLPGRTALSGAGPASPLGPPPAEAPSGRVTRAEALRARLAPFFDTAAEEPRTHAPEPDPPKRFRRS